MRNTRQKAKGKRQKAEGRSVVVWNTVLFLLIGQLFTSCSESPVDTVYFDFSGNKGVYIVNEGNFMYGNSSLSFYDPVAKRVYNQVFMSRNGAPLGDVAQSICLWKNLGFVVVNNSGKIYVIDNTTAEFKGSISGLSSPRYMYIVNSEKAYVTDLYARKITIFNPATFQITGKISVVNSKSQFSQHSTEQMVSYKNLLFVNCWSYDNKILVIDTNTDQLKDSIEVFKQPNSMVLDKNNKLWVMTDGGFDGSAYGYEQPGLLKIDAETREIERTFRFPLGDHPIKMCLNPAGDSIYYINRHVWRMSVNDKRIPDQPFITSENTNIYGGFYSLGIDPSDNEIYVSDAIDHKQNGYVRRYSRAGKLLDDFKVGITPGNFAFKTE